jgi:hypothetical protein
VLTAYPSFGDEWGSTGAQSLLVKPVNTQELLKQLEQLLVAHHEHKTKQSNKASGKRPPHFPALTERPRDAKKAI